MCQMDQSEGVFYLLHANFKCISMRGSEVLTERRNWGLIPRGATENQQCLELIFELHDAALKLAGLVNISFIILALFRR